MYCKHGSGDPGCVACAIEAQTNRIVSYLIPQKKGPKWPTRTEKVMIGVGVVIILENLLLLIMLYVLNVARF
jgi:hypothetical protein